MKFDVALKIDEFAKHKSGIIISIKEDLKTYFKNKDYGDDLLEYSILLICVGEKFDNLFKVNKPRFINHRLSTNRFTGLPHEMNKIFLTDVKFTQQEYNAFIKAIEIDSKKLITRKIFSSLENLNYLPAKEKKFDKNQFKEDMFSFFEEQKVI